MAAAQVCCRNLPARRAIVPATINAEAAMSDTRRKPQTAPTPAPDKAQRPKKTGRAAARDTRAAEVKAPGEELSGEGTPGMTITGGGGHA
jgi:hypothetical protein